MRRQLGHARTSRSVLSREVPLVAPRQARRRWARIVVYEPPVRVIFSWDISPEWTLETDLDMTSEIEVRFYEETPQRTRVELEHRGLERHGASWESVARGVEGDDGWSLYLARYVALVARSAVRATSRR